MKTKKIFYLNAMLNADVGKIFSDGISQAFHSHPAARNTELIERSFFYGKNRISASEMPRLLLEENVSGVILSGSEKNTSDPDDPWVKEYIRGLRGLMEYPTDPLDQWFGPAFPIFGICFGHQALAVALGGEVSRFSYTEGLKTILPRRQSKTHAALKELCANSPNGFVMPVTHGDQVVRLPKGTHLLATSDYCECQAFAHDQWKILGIQSHPEMTLEIQKIRSEGTWGSVSPADMKNHAGPKVLEAVLSWMLNT